MTKLKLSDQRFLDESIERARPKTAERLDGDTLSSLKGIADHSRRESKALLPTAEGEYEPVSFTNPGDGRRVYGWLVAVTSDGEARVEIGDGEYAIVPPTELRRVGQKENREKIQADLRRAIGQVSLTDDGVRADMHETVSPMPIGQIDASGKEVHLLSLGYSTSYGHPSQFEISSYVQRFHPTASILEIDSAMPGRIGVAVRLADHDVVAEHDVEAEMGAAHGGEVEEVLDPADVEKDDGHEKEAQMFGKKPDISAAEAAKALAGMGQKDLVDKALRTFFQNGGAGVFIKNPTVSANLTSLLAMAMPTVKRADPGLWRTIAQKAVTNLAGQEQVPSKPGVGPGQPGGPAQQGQTTTTGLAWNPNQSAQTVIQQDQAQQQQPTSVQELAQGQMEQPSQAGPLPPADNSSPNANLQGQPALQKYVQQIKDNPETSKLSPELTNDLAEKMMTQDMAKQPGSPGAGQMQGVSSPEAENVGPKMSGAGSKRAGLFEKKGFGTDLKNEKNGGSPTISNMGPPGGAASSVAEKRLEQYSHLTNHGLPPAMSQVFASMKMHRFARRGDYVVAKVEFEPACMKGRTAHAIKNTVISFVKAKAGMSHQGSDFGIMGKVYVLSLDESSAMVQFASSLQGPVPAMMVKE